MDEAGTNQAGVEEASTDKAGVDEAGYVGRCRAGDYELGEG